MNFFLQANRRRNEVHIFAESKFFSPYHFAKINWKLSQCERERKKKIRILNAIFNYFPFSFFFCSKILMHRERRKNKTSTTINMTSSGNLLLLSFLLIVYNGKLHLFFSFHFIWFDNPSSVRSTAFFFAFLLKIWNFRFSSANLLIFKLIFLFWSEVYSNSFHFERQRELRKLMEWEAEEMRTEYSNVKLTNKWK